MYGKSGIGSVLNVDELKGSITGKIFGSATADSQENLIDGENRDDICPKHYDVNYRQNMDCSFGIPVAGGKSMPMAGQIIETEEEEVVIRSNDPLMRNRHYLQNLNQTRVLGTESEVASSVALVAPVQTAMLPHYIRSDESGISSDKQTRI